jgi:thiol-disulfide isomerase/thioredoxin
MRLKNFSLILAAALVISSAVLGAQAKKEKPATDKAPRMSAPAVSPNPSSVQVQTLDGKTVSLAEIFGGKPTMLVFWASWCPDCKRETPRVKEAFERFAKKGLNLVAVDVARKDPVANVRRYIEENGLKYPVYYDAKGTADKAYDIKWIPTVLLIDRSGKVVSKAPHVEMARIEAFLKKAQVKGRVK